MRAWIGTLGTALLASWAACGPASAQDPADCTPRRQAELAVELVQTLPRVTLSVAGGPIRFILDTGAERTLVTPEAAKRLGLTAQEAYPRAVQGLTGGIGANDARLQHLTAGGHALPDAGVLVSAVALPSDPDRPTDGLLGADILADFDVDLDLPHRRVTLYTKRSCQASPLPWSFSYDTIAAHRSLHDHLFFPVSLDGHQLAAVIDTGSQTTVLDTQAAMTAGLSAALLDHDTASTIRGATAVAAASHRHRFRRLEVGGEAFANATVTITRFSLEDADLILGIDFLASRRVWFSYGTHQLFIAPSGAGNAF
jgi:predicted aspartyl protease